MTTPYFVQRQLAFAAHLRDPTHVPPPEDIAEVRLSVYRDLFYRNIEGFIASALPICKQVLGDNAWHQLVRDFYAQHRCESPFFLDISREFVDYLWAECDLAHLPAFFNELALFEWLDLHVQISDVEPAAHRQQGDLLLDRPMVNPWLVLQNFTYPVQTIPVKTIPLQTMPGQTRSVESLLTEPLTAPNFLVIYRDLQHQVHRLALNAISARCLSLLQSQQPITGLTVLNQVADELVYGVVERQHFLSFGAQTFLDWQHKNILLGTWLN